MAKPRWATALAAVVRPVAIVLGATFAIHRLAGRLDPAIDGSEPGADGALSAYPERLLDALTPEQTVIEAAGRTALLAGSAAVVALLVGWIVVAARTRFGAGRPGRTDRPVSDHWSGLALAIAVPGLTWLPLHRLAVEQGVLPESAAGPLGGDPSPLRSLALWAVLLGLSLGPTVAAAWSGGRFWTSGGSGGHVALGSTATRTSSGPVWRIGFPAVTFGVSLALAEVAASTGGLIDRFVDAIELGRSDDLLGLATPVVVAGALLVPTADVGASILRRVERPDAPGTDRVRRRSGPALLAIVLVVLVGATAVIGLLIDADADPSGQALASPSLGGPWLGTDELGRSVAARTAAALGATLAGSVVPALAATVVGAGLAFFRRTQRPASQSTIDILLDLVSWPAMLVLPLAAWPVDGAERTLLDPAVLQIIGLLLVPMATRLLIRPVRGVVRVARLASTAAVVAGSALAIQLLAGFVVPLGDGDQPGLGHLVAAGLADPSSRPWPLTAALVAAVAAAGAFHASIGALTRVGRTLPRAGDGEAGWSADNPGGALLGPSEAEQHSTEPIDVTPPRITLADDTNPPSPAPPHSPTPVPGEPVIAARRAGDIDDRATTEAPELFPASDITTGPSVPASPAVVEQPAPPEPPEALDQVSLGGVGRNGGDDIDAAKGMPTAQGMAAIDERGEPIDIRDDVAVSTVVDVPAADTRADARADGRGERSIEDEASQTVELRPSDLRRAGVQPEPD